MLRSEKQPNVFLRVLAMASCLWPPKKLVWMVFLGSTLVLLTFLNQPPMHVVLDHPYLHYDLEAEEPRDNAQTCQLPRLHPFDSSILRYLTPPKPIRCKSRQELLTFIDWKGYLRKNESAFKAARYSLDALTCRYQEIRRPTSSDSTVEYGSEMVLAENGSRLSTDFVSVWCTNFAGITVYSNVHAHVLPAPAVPAMSAGPRYSVLVVGIDSLSRLSFIRQLPRTYSYLTQDMNAVVMRGMTKVGDNTFPNLAALLTGLSVDAGELTRDGPFDEWPLVWRQFTQAGYVTMYAEDRPDIALFNYLRDGFREQPTHHYLRPFWVAVYASRLHLVSSNMCFGSVPKHILQLNYTRDMVMQYSRLNAPYFAFSFLVELSHDYISQVGVADDDLLEMLSSLHRGGHLNRTLLVFMSDHGHRFDAVRATFVGRVEERMPFFAVVSPSELLLENAHIAETLRLNSGRLTSPYDAYFTFVDIIDHGTRGSPLGSARGRRGMSLFAPVLANRTCQDASIPEHYCTCEEEQPLDPGSDARPRLAAQMLVETLNQHLIVGNVTTVCQTLSLAEVMQAVLVVASQRVVTNSRVYFGQEVRDDSAQGLISKLRIVVRTLPGDALFEATLQYRQDEQSFQVLGDISRINAYGTQSWCVSEAILRKFCYCVQQSPPR